MFAKLARSLIAFGVVFVAYQVYALAVVPMLEPPRVMRSASQGGMINPARNPVEKSQQLLAAYFPPDHWSLKGRPIVIESGQVMLVLNDFQRDDRGRVDLTRCVVLIFPTPRQQGKQPPRDAVIVEAPQGANLEFDRDFNPSRGRIGKIVQGMFPGKIVIRSDMRQPGPADDLLIETSNLYMKDNLISTPAEVAFRLGNNRLDGRHLEIALLEEEHQQPGAEGFGISGVKHLEIFDNVRLELQIGKLNLAESVAVGNVRPAGFVRPDRFQLTAHRPGETLDAEANAWADGPEMPSVYDPRGPAKPAMPAAAAAPRPPAPAAPLEITCQDSFHLSFLDFTATFHRKVVATQLSFTGQSDQLTCERLAIRFSGDANGPLSPQDDPDFTDSQRDALGTMRPVLVEAIGDPVNVNSPSRGAMARCGRLRIDLDRRLLTLTDGSPSLTQNGNEVTAPVISYEHPAKGDPAAIGRMWLAGPGQIRVVPRASNPQETIEAHWNAVPGVDYPVQLMRVNDRPVLMVEGRPQVSGSQIGRLTSDRVRIALREVPADGKEGPAIELGGASTGRLALLPERVDAMGAVRIESPELTARTGELTVWVRPDATPSPVAQSDGGDGLIGRHDEQLNAPQQTYTLDARKMELDLIMQGRHATPANLVCQGGVRFSEVSNQNASRTPLGVTGERLKVNNLKSGSVEVRVDGGEGQAGAALAEIVAQGLTLRAATVKLNQSTNRLWADGAGNARVQLNRDLTGQVTRAATDLHLNWQGGLDFDGQRITVRDEVFGQGPHDWVRCEQVTATLNRPIDFGRSRDTSDIQIAQVDCTGGVTLDHRGVDPQGQRSHERAKIETLSLNQATGAISGDGPGWVRSVRLESGGGFAAFGPEPKQPAAGAPPEAAKSSLQFLRVKFLRGVSGNLNDRVLRFEGDVRAVHGPVAAWEQELPIDHPAGLPPDTATLKCQQLTVNEDPLARMTGNASLKKNSLGPIEMLAKGSVQIQGAAEGKGLFTAYAAAASYSKAKEMFTLEGDGQADATLYQQEAPGAQPSQFQAQKLIYWRLTKVVKVENFGRGTTGSASATAPRPGIPRR